LKSYRPVSNLPLLAKLLEKVVQGQLQRYLTANNAMPQHQSAYRQYHSTETTLIKITNDLLQAADHGLVSPLCMLDLTAAFDTIDHSLLRSVTPTRTIRCRTHMLSVVRFLLVRADLLRCCGWTFI